MKENLNYVNEKGEIFTPHYADDGIMDATGEDVYRRYAAKQNVPAPEPTPAEQIYSLKQQIESTDYKIIKCSECQLAGMPLPYDVRALHEERQALRDKINVLENVAS